MRELPILFNTEMVQAILEGRKTMTRRPIKGYFDVCFNSNKEVTDVQRKDEDDRHIGSIKSPYQVGDRLYVRETWGIGSRPCPREGFIEGVEFKADCKYLDGYDSLNIYSKDEVLAKHWGIGSGWKPSIHMPKEYARIWLEITDVRVERVQNIDDEQGGKEGMAFYTGLKKYCDSGRELFKHCWNSIYKNWDKNPFVWVYEFKVLTKEGSK